MINDRGSIRLDPGTLTESMFLSSYPCVAGFPHVLVKAGEATLRAISRVAGVALGLWGERPMFTADGKHYLEPDNSKIEDDFVLWKLRANQEYLFERANVAPDPSFKMFISADVPVSALKRTYEHFQDDFDDAPSFADYIEYVCDWLPDLRWALIPLEGETGWSIFAVAPGAEDLLEKLRTEFRRNQIPTAHLAKEKDRFQWVDG